jgi:hypothetical protein
MDSKRNPASKKATDLTKASRRRFLTTGAAAAALGAVRTATGQASAAETRSLKDQVAYGDRSHYVTSQRVAVDGRPSPDEFGMTFHVLAPLQDFVDASRGDRAGYRSPAAPADDSRPGRQAAGVQHG